MTASDCRSLFSCQYPVCHSRLPPSVILDLLRLSSLTSSVCHSSPSSFCHPCLLPSVILAFFLLSSSPSSSSSTLVIEDPVSLPFPSFVRRTTLDSCFRRNDSRLPFSLLCSGGISCRPYNCGEAVVFVAASSHGAVRFLAASAGGMRCRPYNCTTTLDSCFRRNDREGAGMTEKERE